MKWLAKFRELVVNYWVYSLAIIATILFIANISLFYPGYMSADSLHQLGQVLGTMPITDWHPPVMVLVWRALFFLTDHISSMLIFQTLLLWSGLALFAVSIYTITHSLRLSLLPLALGLLPFVLNISGVIWKDVQMAHALLFAVALLVFVSVMKFRDYVRWPIFIAVTMLVSYATLLRYNVIFAVLPIILLLALSIPQIASQKWKYLLVIGICGLIGAGYGLTNIIMKPQETHPASAVMLDDVINIVSRSELQSMAIDTTLKNDLLKIQDRCKDTGKVMNAFVACTNDLERNRVSLVSYNELRAVWQQAIMTNFLGYIGYRAETFVLFLFVPEAYAYVWQDGIEANELSQSVGSERLGNILSVYVLDFGYRHMPFLYQPWFWLILGLIIFWSSLSMKRYRNYTVALTLSAIIYILTYIPVVVAADYRYIYWPVLACMMAGALLFIERKTIKS